MRILSFLLTAIIPPIDENIIVIISLYNDIKDKLEELEIIPAINMIVNNATPVIIPYIKPDDLIVLPEVYPEK